MAEAEVRLMKSHKPRNAVTTSSWERQDKGFFPRVSRKNTALLTHCRLLIPRTMK